MDFRDYKSFWNDKAATPVGARIAVDGSTDEHTLRLTGAFSAAQARAALDLQPTDRVFELGCGVGRMAAPETIIAEVRMLFVKKYPSANSPTARSMEFG